MFPNLRLIIGAAIATIALVVIMGSGLPSLRDPYRGIAELPELRRPFVQHSIVENPDLQQFRQLAYARRSDELQRLLDLPAGPLQADAPEPPTAYAFKVTPSPEELSAPPEASSAAVQPAEPAVEPTAAQPDTAGSAALSLPSEPAPEPPAAEPVDTVDTQATPPAPPPPVAPATETAAMALDDAPPAAPEAASETAAHAPPADDQTGAIAASPIPAIEHPPLPPRNPRDALNRADSGVAATVRPAASRALRARPPKTTVQTARVLPRRAISRTPPVAPATPSPFGFPPAPPSPSKSDLFSQRPYNIQ